MQNQLTTTNLTTTWAKLANSKQNTAQDFVLYTILRAIAGQREDAVANAPRKIPRKTPAFYIQRAFSPISNSVKLANGRYAHDTLSDVLHRFLVVNGFWVRTTAERFGIELTSELANEIANVAHDAWVEIKRNLNER